MRYQLNERVIGIRVRFEPSEPRFSSLYYPDTDKLLGIDLVEMKVIKHEKVAWDQDPNEEPKYDGYVLEEPDGTLHHNQYPKASYGQIDDSMDRRFTPAAWNDDNLFDYLEDVTAYLRRLVSALANGKIAGALREALSKHHDDVIKLIQQKFPVRVTYATRENIPTIRGARCILEWREVKKFTLYWCNGKKETSSGSDLVDALSYPKIKGGIHADGSNMANVLGALDYAVEGVDDNYEWVDEPATDTEPKRQGWFKKQVVKSTE
jgi:hypothetical protein